jgi:pimeloyl-ACP methyl ester carboxylesterase
MSINARRIGDRIGMRYSTWWVVVDAWRSKPSSYLIATEDRMIAPSAQRAMAQRAGATTVEVAASHAVYMSQPAQTAALIRQACI